jgi:hypothetical protein
VGAIATWRMKTLALILRQGSYFAPLLFRKHLLITYIHCMYCLISFVLIEFRGNTMCILCIYIAYLLHIYSRYYSKTYILVKRT